MLDFIYNLLIMPIELIVQVTFYIMYKFFHENCGIAIVAVSLVIQTLVLPLYNRADKVQEEERERQNAMSHWVSHIRKTFKGEERFMMLSYYYKMMNYKPVYALRSSISLLLQIPFFIAAYQYLSKLTMLNGQRFLFINDLGAPDAVAGIGGFTINIMPILMTLINIFSGVVYTKGWSLRDKLQTYLLALFFLVFLYNSPAGLVLYWTVNQIYSLIKNIVIKIFLRSPRKEHREMFIDRYLGKIKVDQKHFYRIYLASAVFAALFIGGLIPLNIVSSSAAEFMTGSVGPLSIVLHNLAVFIGLFVIWGSVFCYLTREKYRPFFILFMVLVSFIGIVDYLFWGNDFGTMSEMLVYEKGRDFTHADKIVNLIVIFTVFLVVIIVSYFYMDIVYKTLRILLTVVAVYCIFCVFTVTKQIDGVNIAKAEVGSRQILNISKKGHNVIFFMLDRAIDGYIPYIFDENPDLKEAYAGFTWYSNTMSHGSFTNFGVPELYGGYEYTPAAMNARKDEKLVDKHDEALLVLPRIFGEAGYNVTVCDPPYAGYQWVPDLTIYDDYDYVEAYNLEGMFSGNAELESVVKKKQQGAFIYHCIMRASPVICQKILYKDGKYMSEYMPLSVDLRFLNCYSAIEKLTSLTHISDGEDDNFLQLQNDITHNPVLLKTPEYVPDEGISVTITNWQAPYEGEDKVLGDKILKMDNVDQAAHYHVNVAALESLSKWFDYLKENECWDNTRIILAADHGRNLGQFDYMMLGNRVDVELYNPLLLVKDFGDTEYKESDEFMTNADVPALATDGLIDDPMNPFTGKRLDEDHRSEKQLLTTSYNWGVVGNAGCEFDTSDGRWYEVTPGNIFDESNWKLIE